MKLAAVCDLSEPMTGVGLGFGTQSCDLLGCDSPMLASVPVLERLAAEGHAVTLYTLCDRRTHGDRAHDENGVCHIPLPSQRGRVPRWGTARHRRDAARALLHRWEKDPPDIVHAYGATAAALAIPVARTLGIRTVRDLIGQDPTDDPNRSGPPADMVIVHSMDAACAVARHGVPSHSVRVVPLGVESSPSFRTSEAPETPGAPPCLGWLCDPDDGDSVTAAALAVVDAVPDARMVLGTRGWRTKRAIERQRPTSQHPARVEVIDRDRDEWVRALCSADLIVCPRSHDNLAVTALEAMAHGVPVVAAATGMLLDVVEHAVTGELVPEGDPVALAAATQRVVNDAILRLEYGVASADRVRTHHSWPSIAGHTELLYAELLDGNTRGVAEDPGRTGATCAVTTGTRARR